MDKDETRELLIQLTDNISTGDSSPLDMKLSYSFQQSLVEEQKWFPYMLIVTQSLGNLSIPVPRGYIFHDR